MSLDSEEKIHDEFLDSLYGKKDPLDEPVRVYVEYMDQHGNISPNPIDIEWTDAAKLRKDMLHLAMRVTELENYRFNKLKGELEEWKKKALKLEMKLKAKKPKKTVNLKKTLKSMDLNRKLMKKK